MSTKWLIGFIFAWGLLTVISGICEYTVFGDSETNLLQQLMTAPDITSSTSILGSATAWIDYGSTFISTLWDMFWFDYSFFQGQWLLVKYIVFMPVSIGIAVSFGMALVRGVSSE